MSFAWHGPEHLRAVDVAAARGVTKAAERLKAVSVPRAPLDDGPLRGSAGVVPATPADPTALVYYDTPYAVRQHEELDYVHTDGEAKYLERPLNEHQKELQGIIAAEIRRATNG